MEDPPEQCAVSLYGCHLDTFGNVPEHVACVPLEVGFLSTRAYVSVA